MVTQFYEGFEFHMEESSLHDEFGDEGSFR